MSEKEQRRQSIGRRVLSAAAKKRASLMRRFSRGEPSDPFSGAAPPSLEETAQMGDGGLAKASPDAAKGEEPEDLVDARPSELARIYAARGAAELDQGKAAEAVESYSFALSYSGVKAQATAYVGLARSQLAIAKKLGKTKRAKPREAALASAEQAVKLAEKYNKDLVKEASRILQEIQKLPFKAVS